LSVTIHVPPQMLLERILTLEIVRVTERAAVSAARLRRHGNEKAADQAAVDAMRRELNNDRGHRVDRRGRARRGADALYRR
jgi:fructose-1,6-bisphosphatase II / sedoheptulose-1,7-bisphosphatase